MSSSSSSSASLKPPSRSSSCLRLSYTLILPILAAAALYRLDSFDPSPLPYHQIPHPFLTAPAQNGQLLRGAERIGFPDLQAPEDLVYDEETRFIYTGCADGWVKRVSVAEEAAVVEKVAFTGGRPLGLAKGLYGNWIVADVAKGLLNVTKDGNVELLATEAEGLPFALTDAVDVAKDGLIYFTDASHKYTFKNYLLDILEGKPHGRFLSYNPFTRSTQVLATDLYFANGVVVSPDQSHAIFCETVMQRCMKYHLRGSKRGTVEKFIEGLPGGPDNIHYNADGHYTIGLSTGASFIWNTLVKYPSVRKITAMYHKAVGLADIGREGGVMIVDKEGRPVAHYHDVKLSMSSSAISVGDNLYIGSVMYPYILRLNTTKYPAI
uniref:Strictosidine synthase conserved region domain-containing protein n=1 Tax=Kalanchoe fedtschenkoi TaxID=63787 RepID=A0A7N1A2V4_KALFE